MTLLKLLVLGILLQIFSKSPVNPCYDLGNEIIQKRLAQSDNNICSDRYNGVSLSDL